MERFAYKKSLLIGLFTLLSFNQWTLAGNTQYPEQEAIFTAAGFKNTNGAWRGKCSFGYITLNRDLNGDGRPDAIIRDGGSQCYGTTGIGFHLVTKQATGKWTRILNSPGEPEFLSSIGRHGWPDISIQNSSQCHQIYSWDGSKFVKNRQEYKGKPCLINGL